MTGNSTAAEQRGLNVSAGLATSLSITFAKCIVPYYFSLARLIRSLASSSYPSFGYWSMTR